MMRIIILNIIANWYVVTRYIKVLFLEYILFSNQFNKGNMC